MSDTITDQFVKDATTEYLSHRGEQPYRVLRGGQQLWETHATAMRAALASAHRLSPAVAPCTREPVAWEVWWGVGEMTRGSELFRSREAAQRNADQIKSNTEVRPLYDEPASSADLTSLRLALGQIVERANKPSAGEIELQTKIADMYRTARYALLPLPDGASALCSKNGGPAS